MEKTSRLPAAFNMKNMKKKSIAFLIEHSPCCILSFAAGFIGLPMLAHNPPIELCFAIFGAIIGEYIGHRIFHKHDSCSHDACARAVIRRYGLSLLIGLASWGAHQTLFHHPAHTHHAAIHSVKLPV